MGGIEGENREEAPEESIAVDGPPTMRAAGKRLSVATDTVSGGTPAISVSVRLPPSSLPPFLPVYPSGSYRKLKTSQGLPSQSFRSG